MKSVGRITIYDNGSDGMSIRFTDTSSCYECISGDDMLEYQYDELQPSFYSKLTKEEQGFIDKEFIRIKGNAKHHDYYDAYDNTWKDYE